MSGAGAGLLAVIVIGGLLAGGGTRPRSRPGDLVLQADNTAFSRSRLEAHRQNIVIVLANHDLFWHTFTIDSLDVDLKVPVEGERTVAFSAPPGRYQFYCRIPGHSSAGMRGTLIVR
jgi:plastocyanin